MTPEPLRAQIALGDCDHLHRLAETLNWQQSALLALNHPASASNSDRQRAAESPMSSVAR